VKVEDGAPPQGGGDGWLHIICRFLRHWIFFVCVLINTSGKKGEKPKTGNLVYSGLSSSDQTRAKGSVKQLSSATGPVLSDISCLPWGESRLDVEAMSVFHRKEKVTRLVTQNELMDAYDLELSVQKALKTLGKTTSLSCSFVKQIPTKVLRSIGLKVVEILNEVPAVDDTMSVSSDQTILYSNKVQGS